jgi:hypothetical protein
LAGEQEAALRAMVSDHGARPGAGVAWTEERRERSDRSDEGRRRRRWPRGPRERSERIRQSPGRGVTGTVDGLVNLVAALERHAGPDVTLAAPAEPVPVPVPAADAVTGAVAAALDNVRRHAGPEPRAWVLVENEAGTVTVTVRDDGPGIPAGRLAIAAGEGRLGVSQSIQGRIADVGGSVTITSEPGQGTEVEIRLSTASLG